MRRKQNIDLNMQQQLQHLESDFLKQRASIIHQAARRSQEAEAKIEREKQERLARIIEEEKAQAHPVLQIANNEKKHIAELAGQMIIARLERERATASGQQLAQIEQLAHEALLLIRPHLSPAWVAPAWE